MKLNAIQMREEIDKLIDRVKSPRFIDDSYYSAINQASKMILDDRTENIKRKREFSLQSSQRLRNELYSLVKPTYEATINSNIVSFPSDYYYLLLMMNTIDGNTSVCKPITFNEKGLINNNPFKRPNSAQTYYTENLNGWQIELPANSSFTKCEIDYIKMPNVVSIGTDSDKLTSSNALVIGSEYIVYEKAIHNNIVYYEGNKFIASNTILDSGKVILVSKIKDSDMPEHLHDEIVRLSAAIMNGTVEDYQKENNLLSKNEMS